jgi:hypothetical protein
LFVYRFIRSMGGWDNWQLIVHDKKPVKDITEAVLHERKWCEFYMATLNKQVPSRTRAEYYVDHHDKINKRQAVYNADHRDEIKIKAAEYRANHRDEKNKKQAAYYADHRDEKAAYYVANEARFKEKHECACGGCYTTIGKSQHNKTKRHMAYIATL